MTLTGMTLSDMLNRDCKDCVHFNSKSLQDKTQHYCLKNFKAAACFGCDEYKIKQQGETNDLLENYTAKKVIKKVIKGVLYNKDGTVDYVFDDVKLDEVIAPFENEADAERNWDKTLFLSSSKDFEFSFESADISEDVLYLLGILCWYDWWNKDSVEYDFEVRDFIDTELDEIAKKKIVENANKEKLHDVRFQQNIFYS